SPPHEVARGFEMTALRPTVYSPSLQSGVGGKSPRDAALVRMMRTGERESCTRFGEFRGFVSRRRKAGSLHGSSQIRSSIAFLKRRPGVALVDSDRLQLRRPVERQIDPVEQRLGVELSRLMPSADCFDDAGCCECQARETLEVTHSDALASRDLRK